MNNVRTSKVCAAVLLAAGVVTGPILGQAVAAESGLINVVRSQDLHTEQIWSDALPAGRVLSSSQADAGGSNLADEDEDVQRYVQMHEDALDAPIRSFLLPWSTLQQIAN
jgi:hypothetical protein